MEPRALLHTLHHYKLQVKIILAEFFSLAVSTQTAKLPNLISCQIFRLYGMRKCKSGEKQGVFIT